MPTARLLTVSRSAGGRLSAYGKGEVVSAKGVGWVSALGGICLGGVCLGRCLPRSVCPKECWDVHPPRDTQL